MLDCNVPVKALFRLSDALKCTDLSTTKPQLKSCVREQNFHSFQSRYKKRLYSYLYSLSLFFSVRRNVL
nr:MAG TPA: hypothetical protein [Caudoviricetes sp.]